VFEEVYGGNDLWLTNASAQVLKDNAPDTSPGSGSQWHGTPAAWQGVLEEFGFTVIGMGFSLGSGVLSDGTLTEVTAGCHTMLFDALVPPTTTTTTTTTTSTTTTTTIPSTSTTVAPTTTTTTSLSTTTTLPETFIFGAATTVCQQGAPTIVIEFQNLFPSLAGVTGTLTMTDINGNFVSSQPLVYEPGTTVNILYPGTEANPGWIDR
jgi:hypothetical protein